MTDRLKKKIEDMDITPEELGRFTEAFKKEEFRKLFAEYAEEISNPENRKIYERELEQLENERGVDVTFIHPEPGFVIKTTQNGDQKCFINICKNSNVKKPTSDVTKKKESDGSIRKGITWSIPHSCAPPKDDLDKSGNRCIVYDVVFHPDSYRMGETNDKFKEILKDTACETIERNFKAKLDRKNMKILKMSFKGTPTATVVRRPKENTDEHFDLNDKNDPLNRIKTPYSYPPKPDEQEKTSEETSKPLENKEELPKQGATKQDPNPVKTEENPYTTPKYTIINRGHSDLQDCMNERHSTHVNSTRPKEICIDIDLPLCKNVSSVKLDIYEKSLCLESQKPFYKLDLNLPYPVDENNGNAKFDKTKKILSVTLPVLPFIMKIEEKANLVEETDTFVETPSDVQQCSDAAPIPFGPSQSSANDAIEEQDDEWTKNNYSANIDIPRPVKAEMNVKYNMPSKCALEQNSKTFKLTLFTNNIDQNSVAFTIKPSSMHVKYESSGSGGYITYHSMCIKFPRDFIDVAQPVSTFHPNNTIMVTKFHKLNEHLVQNADVSLDEHDACTTVSILGLNLINLTPLELFSKNGIFKKES
jgi:dynein assembly factor 2